jgi:hypothetical protein
MFLSLAEAISYVKNEVNGLYEADKVIELAKQRFEKKTASLEDILKDVSENDIQKTYVLFKELVDDENMENIEVDQIEVTSVYADKELLFCSEDEQEALDYMLNESIANDTGIYYNLTKEFVPKDTIYKFGKKKLTFRY